MKINVLDITDLKRQHESLNERVDTTSAALGKYLKGKRGQMGLVSEDAKTPEYWALKHDYSQAFQELRSFNGKYIKLLRKSA